MCNYHAYSHLCGHTEMIFQGFCPPGQMTQQKCAGGHQGTIVTTLKIEYPCSSC
ncbi:hypothetical protein EJ04DRAFT_402542, partial [Polyplosphaeria fusca]